MYRSASSLLPHVGMSEEHRCHKRDCVHRPRPPTRLPTAGSSTNVNTHSMQFDSGAHRNERTVDVPRRDRVRQEPPGRKITSERTWWRDAAGGGVHTVRSGTHRQRRHGRLVPTVTPSVVACTHSCWSVATECRCDRRPGSWCPNLSSDRGVPKPTLIVSNAARSWSSSWINGATERATLSFPGRLQIDRVGLLACSTGLLLDRGQATKCATLLYKREMTVCQVVHVGSLRRVAVAAPRPPNMARRQRMIGSEQVPQQVTACCDRAVTVL